jgi:hypothetical protein
MEARWHSSQSHERSSGFVQFVHRHAAEMAINQMQGYPIGNSRVRLSWGRSQNNSGVGTDNDITNQCRSRDCDVIFPHSKSCSRLVRAATNKTLMLPNHRRVVNTRQFREERYNFPSDDPEQEREDMKHAMLRPRLPPSLEPFVAPGEIDRISGDFHC